VQLMTMSSADFLDQWFETDALKATMSASGIIGTFLGIRSPGTAYVLLHHYMGEIDGAFRSWGFSRGGTGAISNAIASAARELGVEIRTKAPVSKILTKNGQVCGVALLSGEEISAEVVSSSVDPHLTFEKFLERSELPADFLESVRHYKFRGSSGKVNLALDELPNFKCLPGPGAHLRGAISISPGMDYMERAYDDAKYGHYSRRPYIDMVIPSLTDPSVAPPGKHVLSCFVQYAPYKLAEGSWDEQREAFGNNVIETIAEYAPNIKNIIVGKQVLTPLDLEREFGLTQGNIFQGELSLEQLFFLRPDSSRLFSSAAKPLVAAPSLRSFIPAFTRPLWRTPWGLCAPISGATCSSTGLAARCFLPIPGCSLLRRTAKRCSSITIPLKPRQTLPIFRKRTLGSTPNSPNRSNPLVKFSRSSLP